VDIAESLRSQSGVVAITEREGMLLMRKRGRGEAGPKGAGAGKGAGKAEVHGAAAPSLKKKSVQELENSLELDDDLEPINRDVAGIDIGSEEHFVSVPPNRAEQPVRTFGCFTPDLHEMAKWLKACDILSVVMESTGIYWVPVYRVLEQYGFKILLVDGHATKRVAARKKSDVQDCCWLRKLHMYGLLSGCFVPASDVLEMRTYWRQRETLVAAAASQLNGMQKSLEQMNVQIHKVLSDISGITGMNILRAILAGQRDPLVLAKMRQRTVKSSEETLVKALTGNYEEAPLFTLKQAMDTYDFIHRQIGECDLRLQERMAQFATRPAPRVASDDRAEGDRAEGDGAEDKEVAGELLAGTHEVCEQIGTIAHRRQKKGERNRRRRSKNEPSVDLRDELRRITGVDLTTIDGISVQTALSIITECGPDLAAWPTEDQFASWTTLAPNNRISGGKILKKTKRRSQNRVAQSLRVAAQSIHHSHSAIGAFYRRMRARLSGPAAITAVAHKLARYIYRMIRYGQEYVDKGQEWYEQQYEAIQRARVQKEAARLGYCLVDALTGEVS